MTAAEKEEIKQAMEEALKAAQKKIIQFQEASKSVAPDNAIGRVSRMDAIGNKAVNDMALQKAKNKIELLESALANYETAEFGCCSSCYQDIGFKRLKAMPEIDTCMYCASL